MPSPKAEKPAKPRKAPAKKKTTPEPIAIRPTHDQIAALAHQFWAERGYAHGHADQDWLRAEEELLKTAS